LIQGPAPILPPAELRSSQRQPEARGPTYRLRHSIRLRRLASKNPGQRWRAGTHPAIWTSSVDANRTWKVDRGQPRL